MTKDAIAFLDGEPVEEPQEAEAVAPVEAEPAKAEPAPEPEQKGEEQAAPPVAEPEEARAIPVTALLDEREKRQEAQRKAEEADRRARELERKIAELTKPKEETPDWYSDPDKAAQYQARNIEQRFEQQRLAQSRFFAEREFGKDTVEQAIAYFDRHPEQSSQFLREPSPFHSAVEFFKRQQIVEEIGTDPEAYRKKIAEEIRQQVLAEMTQAQPSKPKAPPPSMATAPTTGRDAISPGTGFDDLFPS